MDHMERVRRSCLRRERKHWRKRGLEIWDLDPLMRPIPKPTGRRAFDLPYHEARADKYEATEPQAELTETRRQIRAEPGLSHQCKIVLILVTQIPRGRWTTYATIHVHLLEMGYFCLEGQIGDVLAENTLGGAVPCHRVIAKCGFLGRPMDLGRHCGNHEEVVELLSEEGVKFRADGSLTDDAFRDFVGCPRV
ncbi:hypothetical protein F5Y13DRAFT_151501 [Hypoxylon sp. FL1857]|nr:hypothetical protein F5Y13DRAFT_151501 [Hypoxylon sp. FL1857]